MNESGMKEMIEFDCRRLQKLMQLWVDPGETASPVFLALNIMDFTARLRRHRAGAAGALADLPADLDVIHGTAVRLIEGDPRFADIVFTRMRFDSFLHDVALYLQAVGSGSLTDDEVDLTTGDLVDQYFSFELVLDTAERHLAIPAGWSDTIASFRNAMADAVDRDRYLAEAARMYAETAPGGEDMEPWPELLDQAPDMLFDAVRYKARFVKVAAKAFGKCKELRLVVPTEMEYSMAAESDDPLQYDDKWDLIESEEAEVSLYRYGRQLVLSLAADEPLELPEPIVIAGDDTIDIRRYRPQDKGRHSYLIGSLPEFLNRPIYVVFPGAELATVSVTLTRNTSS